MLNSLLNLNTFLFSALEQFEILTFRGPEFGLGTRIMSYFLPKGLFNNLNMSFFVVIYVLFNLCDLRSQLPYRNLKTKYKVETVSPLNQNDGIFDSIIIVDGKCAKVKIRELTAEISYIVFVVAKFVHDKILENLLYFKSIFLNYTLALFLFLLACNLFGMIPYSLTVTSYLILTLNLSGMSFFANLLIALSVHRLKFFKFFIPNGVSGVLVLLMVVIELISYVARLFSMAIRLFANMMSGHALIKILSGLVFLSLSDIYFFGAINIFLNMILLCVTALEVIVAALQSYVFVVLSVVYTNESIILH